MVDKETKTGRLCVLDNAVLVYKYDILFNKHFIFCLKYINIPMITDPPKVTLSLTNAGPGNVVKVGDTVYLQCNVLSNPPVEKVYWKFQVHIHAHCNGNAHIPMQINDKDMSYKWDAQFSINGNKKQLIDHFYIQLAHIQFLIRKNDTI